MANESIQQKLLACAKRIGELEVELGALRAEKKAIEDNGGDAATLSKMASAIDRRTKELANQRDRHDALVRELEFEAIDRERLEEYRLRKDSYLLEHKNTSMVSWMQNHSGPSGKDTLWEEFLREHPDYGNTEMTVGRSYRTRKSIHVEEIHYDCNNMILDMKDWLERLENQRESFLEIGDDAAVRKVDDEIADCKMQINRLRRKIEAPHKKVKELVLHDVYHKRLASVGKILKLKEQNNMLEDWLRSQECQDANGKQTTYWDLFLADQPDGEMWDYFD